MSVKGIVVTTDNEIRIQEFDKPLYKTIGKVVGGWIEVVHPKGLESPFCMVVNEEGLLENLALNATGCMLYGTAVHGAPIVGNIVILAEGQTPDGIDLISINDDDLEKLTKWLTKACKLKGESQ